MKRIKVLDGWRGISILLVLIGHLFPVGPSFLQLNAAFATSGMAVFFILSGFLITSLLLHDQRIIPFLIRRTLRIIPLSWLVLIIYFSVSGATTHQWLSSLFFYNNLVPIGLTESTSHFWSLSVEMQFYFLAATLVLLFKDKAFLFFPVICVAITGYRIYSGVGVSIHTYYRVDEILAGCTLAVLYYRKHKSWIFPGEYFVLFLFILLLASAHPAGGFLCYLRPYIALAMIGATLDSKSPLVNKILKNSVLSYLAMISYALYIIHGGLRVTWLGSGDTLIKYIKRPFFLLATFGLAHFSTFYYEKFFIRFGKKISSNFK